MRWKNIGRGSDRRRSVTASTRVCLPCSPRPRLLLLIVVLHTGRRNPRRIHSSTNSSTSRWSCVCRCVSRPCVCVCVKCIIHTTQVSIEFGQHQHLPAKDSSAVNNNTCIMMRVCSSELGRFFVILILKKGEEPPALTLQPQETTYELGNERLH